MGGLATILGDFWRFLQFKPLQGDVRAQLGSYLLVGVVITWIVGFGRTWDYPDAPWWFRTGITSVAYAFLLAGFIWMIGAALRPARWSYRNVLLMVLMTAAPGIIYAIPVERFMAEGPARAVNMIFLLIVATWRMLLYRHFLRTVAQLPRTETIVVWLLPPTIIVAVLATLGTLNAIARSMGGVRDPVGDAIDNVIAFIALGAWIALPVLLILFAACAWSRRKVGNTADT